MELDPYNAEQLAAIYERCMTVMPLFSKIHRIDLPKDLFLTLKPEMMRDTVWFIIAGWLISRWFAAVAVVILSTALLAIVSLLSQRPKLPKNAPILIRGWPILGSVDFYLQRCEFLEKQHKRRSGQPFSFYYGPHLIVGLVGEAGRTLLYNSRQFDVRAGYSILLAASPHVETEIDNPALSQINLFKKILTCERLIDSLPKLVEDTDAVFRGLSDREAVVPIFPLMYRLIYKLTHRTGGVYEIAEDDDLLDSTLKRFSSIEHCSLLQIMFPGWPLPSKLSKLWAGFKLHQVIMGVVKERRRTGRNETDALQLLMNLGESDLEIVKCIIGILFSGLLNTGVTSAWLLSYLANDRMWYNKVQAEVDAFIALNRRTAAESVLDILQRVPYHDWDTQLPVIHVCLRETLRLNLFGPAFRKNLSDEDLTIPGTDQVVPKKAFAFYAMDDVHLNESIYPNALQWEPARHLPGREEGANKPHEFVAWGSGLHPCGFKVRYITAMRLQPVLTQSGCNT
ncbi:hypothetical protein MY11210_001184 [Beauveria gryllotalpidicola]